LEAIEFEGIVINFISLVSRSLSSKINLTGCTELKLMIGKTVKIWRRIIPESFDLSWG
jgi:hypothetical protein